MNNPKNIENKKSSYSFPCYGEIYLIYFNPRKGKEVGKLRPALIVSNNIQNEHDHHVIVAPLSDEDWGSLVAVQNFEILIAASDTNGLTKDSKILLNRLRAIDKNLRLRDYCGMASQQIMEKVSKGLELVLNIKKII